MAGNFSNKTVGILGGGQLGRMFIQSAIDFNIDVKILDPDPSAPCKSIASEFECGSLKDYDTVINFAKGIDVLTVEIENVNAEAMQELADGGLKVFPKPATIAMIQDKRLQKKFYEENGIPTAPYILLEKGGDELLQYKDRLPVVQKAGRDGYDGRGVKVINSEADIKNALQTPGLLEEKVKIFKEISIIIARNESGDVAVYPPVELVYHEGQNLVDTLIAPADIPEAYAEKANHIARDLVEKLDYVGLLAVEMFTTAEGEVLVNEIAPRPHNSGHQTIESNITSQYEQHLRSILDMPLGSTKLTSPSAMVNLLGEPEHTGEAYYDGFDKILQEEGIHIHLYGKKITKPYRKMGHVTVTGDSREELVEKIDKVKKHCRIITQP